MYHHSTRPTPVVCALAGSLCTIGVIGIIARAVHEFAGIAIYPPFNSLAFLAAVFCTTSGGVWIGWLHVRKLRAQVAALEADNEGLRQHFAKVDELIAAVKAADEQGEKNYVRLGKLLELGNEIRRRQVAEDDTGSIPRLHSIHGGGGA